MSLPRSTSSSTTPLESIALTPPRESEEEEIPISGPALKKLLLMNLRQKWSQEGVATTAGDAALRFKK
jgi:hypothetical protein